MLVGCKSLRVEFYLDQFVREIAGFGEFLPDFRVCLEVWVSNCEQVPVENILATEQGLKFFGDVSGRFSNSSAHFLFHFSF